MSYTYESLSTQLTDKHMQPFFIEVDVDIDEEIPLQSHDGEEFLYIIDGEIEFHFENEKITLQAGDSIYYDAHIPHAIYGLGSRPPRAVAVLYTPRPGHKD